MDMMAVPERIAVPRPNHSETLESTAVYLKELLTSWGVPFSVQEFPLRPYMMLIVAITILLLASPLPRQCASSSSARITTPKPISGTTFSAPGYTNLASSG